MTLHDDHPLVMAVTEARERVHKAVMEFDNSNNTVAEINIKERGKCPHCGHYTDVKSLYEIGESVGVDYENATLDCPSCRKEFYAFQALDPKSDEDTDHEERDENYAADRTHDEWWE